jgi:hypothetical protein
MRAITLTGMLCAYSTAASITDSPGTTGPIRSSSSLHRRRTSGSHGSIALGENGGSSSRRAIWWNGGSLVIGGAGPTGAGMPGRALLTITPLLVKCSVSYATSCTSSCVIGAHIPPYRDEWATGHPDRRSSDQIS